jgi:MFS superfamily sulfate permease-like transporter
MLSGSLVISLLVRYSDANDDIHVLTKLGITIGAVVVPQGMAYAALAGLPVQYGLYSSFMGVLIYWFFATSKDITIGVSLTTELCGICAVANF